MDSSWVDSGHLAVGRGADLPASASSATCAGAGRPVTGSSPWWGRGFRGWSGSSPPHGAPNALAGGDHRESAFIGGGLGLPAGHSGSQQVVMGITTAAAIFAAAGIGAAAGQGAACCLSPRWATALALFRALKSGTYAGLSMLDGAPVGQVLPR